MLFQQVATITNPCHQIRSPTLTSFPVDVNRVLPGKPFGASVHTKFLSWTSLCISYMVRIMKNLRLMLITVLLFLSSCLTGLVCGQDGVRNGPALFSQKVSQYYFSSSAFIESVNLKFLTITKRLAPTDDTLSQSGFPFSTRTAKDFTGTLFFRNQQHAEGFLSKMFMERKNGQEKTGLYYHGTTLLTENIALLSRFRPSLTSDELNTSRLNGLVEISMKW